MPTYTFKCEKCEHVFDVYARMSQSKGEDIECPNCHEIGKLEQQIGVS
jgi:putative FmdB family regulatory protein